MNKIRLRFLFCCVWFCMAVLFNAVFWKKSPSPFFDGVLFLVGFTLFGDGRFTLSFYLFSWLFTRKTTGKSKSPYWVAKEILDSFATAPSAAVEPHGRPRVGMTKLFVA